MKTVTVELSLQLKVKVQDKADTTEIIQAAKKAVDEKYRYRTKKGRTQGENYVSDEFQAIIIKAE